MKLNIFSDTAFGNLTILKNAYNVEKIRNDNTKSFLW